MSQFVESGRIVDIILVLVLLEAVALVVIRRARGHGPSLAGMFCNLAAGASLMLALRAALMGQGPGLISAWLAAALLAHILDVLGRFRDTGSTVPDRTVASRR